MLQVKPSLKLKRRTDLIEKGSIFLENPKFSGFLRLNIWIHDQGKLNVPFRRINSEIDTLGSELVKIHHKRPMGMIRKIHLKIVLIT